MSVYYLIFSKKQRLIPFRHALLEEHFMLVLKTSLLNKKKNNIVYNLK